MAGFAVARLDEIDEIDDGRRPFRPVRLHFGITTFGITTFGVIAVTAHSDGDRLIPEHQEAEPESGEELYLVMSGHATFELDGETRDAPTGTFVHVPPGHQADRIRANCRHDSTRNRRRARDRPYEPSGWELFAPLHPLFESGDYEEGADRAQALIADDPPYWAVYYNTACFEARVGRTDAALAHLRRAAELSPSYVAELARTDDDLAPLREQAGFAVILGGSSAAPENEAGRPSA